MLNKTLGAFFPTTILTFGNIIYSCSAEAQVTADGTTNTNVTTTNQVIKIENGDRNGDNLFHSFQEFSVPTGSEAFFNNSNDVVNIFSRVTGGNISHVDGLIRANGGANLFLINPAGILFGENAALNLGGSFYGSTADSILFPNGVEFAASNPIKPMLVVNAPIGLRFRDNPGDIVNRSLNNGSGLTVAPGNNLALVGGNITLAGGKITTFGGKGNVELVSVADNNVVDLEPNNTAFKLGSDQVTDFSNITLDQNATIFTNDSAINLRGEQIVLNNGSNIGSNMLPLSNNLTSNNLNSGDISIQARELFINNRSNIFTSTFTNGDAGKINLEITDSITIIGTGFEEIQTTLVEGAITNREALSIPEILENATGILTGTGGRGTSGNINIKASSVQLQEGGIIGGTTLLEGSLGAIKLDIKDSLNVVGSGIFNNPLATSTGQGNSVEIKTKNLTISDGGLINNTVLGTGDGGNITIEASEEINILRTPSNAFVATGVFANSTIGSGKAGDIRINTKRLNIQDGGRITSSSGLVTRTENITQGGKGGSIQINATESIKISDNRTKINGFTSEISSNTFTENNAGNININTPSLSISNGAQISANTSSGTDEVIVAGNGGVITINAKENIDIIGLASGIFSMSETSSTGDAGGIRINTANLRINEGKISVSGEEQGDAGTLIIATDSLTLDDGSITADADSGEGANVDLDIKNNLILENNSLISARAIRDADGGNVKINSSVILAFPSQKPDDGNDIIALAERGRGGDILVTAKAIIGDIAVRKATFGNGTNDIDASSEFGANLILQDIVIDTDMSEANLIESNQVTERLCQANQSNAETTNSLTIKGKSGVPPLPNSLLNADVLIDSNKSVTANLAELNSHKSTQVQPVKTSQGEIYPARGIIFNEDKTITLTAYTTSNSHQRLPNSSLSCSD